MQKPTIQTNYVVNKKEFSFFCFSALGQGMVYGIMSSYVSDFYVSVMQLPVIFVLVLMLLARIWDAVNDPLMGMIVDKANTPWGKLKPYPIFTAIPVLVLTIFMFFVPNSLGSTGLMVYAGFIYIFWGMAYTASDVPFWSLPNVMTPNAEERSKIFSLGRTFNGMGNAVPMALFMILGFVVPEIFDGIVGIELEKRRYLILAVICAVGGTAIFITSGFKVKERVIAPIPKVREKGEDTVLKRILKCKPLMLVIIMGILSSGRYMIQAATVHVARYTFYIGPVLEGLDEAARSKAISGSVSAVSTVFALCSAVGMFGAMVACPFLFKRMNYKKVIIYSCFAGAVASAISAVIGMLGIYYGQNWTLYALIPLIIISALPLGVINVTAFALVGDCLDYMEWETGFRETSLGMACQSFVGKLGNALGTTLIIIMYLIISLNPSDMLSSSTAIAASELSASKRMGMFSLVTVVPAVSLLLCTIPMFFYDFVDGKKERILAELAERRLKKTEE